MGRGFESRIVHFYTFYTTNAFLHVGIQQFYTYGTLTLKYACVSASTTSLHDLPLYMYFNAHANTYCDMRAQSYIYKFNFPMFAEVKVLQQQNMLNVLHMRTLVCKMLKLNYEHLDGHSFIPMVYMFTST